MLLSQYCLHCVRAQQLTGYGPAYTAGIVNLIAVRKALIALRKSVWKSGREAAKAVGLGASTIAKLENVKGKPDYDPGIGVIAKLIEGIAKATDNPAFTVQSFFTQLDGWVEASQKESVKESLRDAMLQATSTTPPQQEQGHNGARLVPTATLTEREIMELIGHSFVKAGADLLASGVGTTATKPRRTVPETRVAKPASRPRGAGHR